MILGSMPFTLSGTNGIIGNGVVENGTARIRLPSYHESVTAVVTGNDFFYGSQGTGTVKYQLDELIQNQRPAGTDPVQNTKFTIFRDYIKNSGAFFYDPATGVYTMVNDLSNKWVDAPLFYPAVTRGYEIMSSVVFSDYELDLGKFNSTTVTVRQYYGVNFPVEQRTTDYNLDKDTFLTMWLSMKLRPWSIGGNPPGPDQLTEIVSLATDIRNLLTKDQN